MKHLRKRKIKQRVYSWPVVIILTIIAFFFITNTWDVYKKYSESRGNIAGLAERNEKALEREQELRKEIEHLKSERGLEEEIRQKFNVAKEGEQVIVIIDPKIEEGVEVQAEEGVLTRWWSKVWDVFR